LGDTALALMPEQPWHDIRGMGNWFRHGYDRIELDVVWRTVQNRLPSLKTDPEARSLMWVPGRTKRRQPVAGG